METVFTEVNVLEEGECREVDTIKSAMDAGAWQGEVGHNPWHVASMAYGTAHDASPLLAWAGVVLPRAHLHRRALESIFPVKKGHPLVL